MNDKDGALRRRLLRELAWFAALLMFGIVLLPVVVYFVGLQVFGAYEGGGFGGFYDNLLARLGHGEASAWFLILSPFVAVAIARLIGWGWRAASTAA